MRKKTNRCSIKRSSCEKVKQRSKSKVGSNETEERDIKERKVRENLQAALLFMIEGHLSLSPFCVELVKVKTLLFQLSLANVAFRAVSRTPLGDFDELLVFCARVSTCFVLCECISTDFFLPDSTG